MFASLDSAEFRFEPYATKSFEISHTPNPLPVRERDKIALFSVDCGINVMGTM